MRGFTGHETATAASEDTVIYHGTTVAKREGNTVTLKTGGWWTVTTKRRMNQAARAWGLPFSVFQRDHEWYIETPGGVQPFPSSGTATFNAFTGAAREPERNLEHLHA